MVDQYLARAKFQVTGYYRTCPVVHHLNFGRCSIVHFGEAYWSGRRSMIWGTGILPMSLMWAKVERVFLC